MLKKFTLSILAVIIIVSLLSITATAAPYKELKIGDGVSRTTQHILIQSMTITALTEAETSDLKKLLEQNSVIIVTTALTATLVGQTKVNGYNIPLR